MHALSDEIDYFNFEANGDDTDPFLVWGEIDRAQL